MKNRAANRKLDTLTIYQNREKRKENEIAHWSNYIFFRNIREGSDDMVYLTGDTHGDFKRIRQLCFQVTPTLDEA